MSSLSSAPLKPPAEWFDQPEPDHAEPLTIERDGRVHGHLAPWEGCHAGLVNGSASACVRPPRSRTDYRMFHLGQLETAEGDMVPVGKVVLGAPHADLSLGLQAATAHYDQTGKVGAFVRARDGRHGIFLSGAARSDLPDTMLRDLRANLPSGDWRLLEHNLELVAALSVPVPGYGIPAMVASSAAGELEAMILTGFTDEGGEVARMEDRDAGYVIEKRLIRERMDAPYLDMQAMTAATYTTEQRMRMAKTGVAMPDGSFPIPNCAAWNDARQAIGRTSPSKRAAVERHIAKRGAALGCKSGD